MSHALDPDAPPPPYEAVESRAYVSPQPLPPQRDRHQVPQLPPRPLPAPSAASGQGSSSRSQFSNSLSALADQHLALAQQRLRERGRGGIGLAAVEALQKRLANVEGRSCSPGGDSRGGGTSVANRAVTFSVTFSYDKSATVRTLEGGTSPKSYEWQPRKGRFTRSDCVLRQTGRDGQVIYTAQRGTQGLFDESVELQRRGERAVVVLGRRHMLSNSLSFEDERGIRFKWKTLEATMDGSITCVVAATEKVVAVWEKKVHTSRSGAGAQLKLKLEYRDLEEIILATALAIEHWFSIN